MESLFDLIFFIMSINFDSSEGRRTFLTILDTFLLPAFMCWRITGSVSWKNFKNWLIVLKGKFVAPPNRTYSISRAALRLWKNSIDFSIASGVISFNVSSPCILQCSMCSSDSAWRVRQFTPPRQLLSTWNKVRKKGIHSSLHFATKIWCEFQSSIFKKICEKQLDSFQSHYHCLRIFHTFLTLSDSELYLHLQPQDLCCKQYRRIEFHRHQLRWCTEILLTTCWRISSVAFWGPNCRSPPWFQKNMLQE